MDEFELIKNYFQRIAKNNPGAKKYGQTYIGYGFEGKIADDLIRNKYINKSISEFKKKLSGIVLIFPDTLEKLKNK